MDRQLDPLISQMQLRFLFQYLHLQPLKLLQVESYYSTLTLEAYGDVSEVPIVFQPVKAPENVFKQFGGLEIRLVG